MDDPIEPLLADCLARLDRDGDAGVESVLAAHPRERDELVRRLEELGEIGLAGPRAESDDFEVPDRLGDFRIVERIGGGGMGVVFRARQLSLDRDVALKVVRPDHLHLSSTRRRFRREVETIARLRHPSIVPVHAFGEDRGIPYFAMELLDGCTLAQLLDHVAGRDPSRLRGAHLRAAVAEITGGETTGGAAVEPGDDGDLFAGTWTDACVRIAARVASALAAAHGRGVLHRDVKPSNVIVTLDCRVMLFDFGLTQSEGSVRMTRTGNIVGSPAYMAPEQVRGERLDPRTDVYALGVTLYELLTLGLPFSARTAPEMLQRVLDGDAVPPRQRNRAVSWDIETVCTVAMDVDRGRRYADATELSADLCRIVAREPIRARRPGTLRRLYRWCQRRPAAAVALALGSITAVGVPNALWLQQKSANVVIAAERASAEQNLTAALGAIDRFLQRFANEELFYTPQLEGVSMALLDDAVRSYEELMAGGVDDPRLSIGCAEAWRNVAWAHRHRGELDEAARAVAESQRVMEQCTARWPDDPRAQRQLASTLQTCGKIARAQSRLPDALECLRRAVAIRAADAGDTTRLQEGIARTDLGSVLFTAGDFAASERELRAGIELLRTHVGDADATGGAPGEASGDAPARHQLAHAIKSLASLQSRRGRMRDAGASILEARRWCEELVERHPTHRSYRYELALTLGMLAENRSFVGKPDGDAAGDRGIALLEGLIDDHPTSRMFRSELADHLGRRGRRLLDRGDVESAVPDLERADAMFARLLREREDRAIRFSRLTLGRRLAKVHASRGDPAEAAAVLEARVDTVAIFDEATLTARETDAVARAHNDAGLYWIQCEDNERAEPALLVAKRLKERLVETAPDSTVYRSGLAVTLNNLAMIYHTTGRAAECAALLRRVVDERRAVVVRSPEQHFHRHGLAGSLTNLAATMPESTEFAAIVSLYAEALEQQLHAIGKRPNRGSYRNRLRDLVRDYTAVLVNADRHSLVRDVASKLIDVATDSYELPIAAAACVAWTLPRIEADASLDDSARDTERRAAIARCLDWLRLAAERGCGEADKVQDGKVFAPIAELPEFARIVAQMREHADSTGGREQRPAQRTDRGPR